MRTCGDIKSGDSLFFYHPTPPEFQQDPSSLPPGKLIQFPMGMV